MTTEEQKAWDGFAAAALTGLLSAESEIPDGQGSSCSMCYGDIAHGNDGYYEEWARQQIEEQTK